MLKIKSLVLGCLVATGTLAATPAFAFQLSPDGNFTATGPTLMSANGVTLLCTSTFQINVTNGVGQVTAASFSGLGICPLLAGQGLPWPMQVPDASSLIINSVRVSAQGISCGPSSVPGTLSNSVFTFNSTLNPGNCQVSGMLTITPPGSIVP